MTALIRTYLLHANIAAKQTEHNLDQSINELMPVMKLMTISSLPVTIGSVY